MNIDNTKEILEFLEYQDRKKAEDTHPVHVIEDDNPYSVVKFVTGNIRGYVDLDHTRSVLIERKVSLLRTKQQGYVPLEYFPSKVRDFSDEMKIKKICSKIIELEKSAMKELLSTDLLASSDMGRVFTPGDIIIGDSKHVKHEIYVPYVDENSLVIREDIVDSEVKKLIKEYYIDKM